jgi:clan AA aspartic protease (TIGR02281 family)
VQTPLLWITLASLACAAPAAAEIYKWVDADGKLHFTTDLSQVPPSQRGRSEAEAKQREVTDPVQRHATPTAPPARRAPSHAGDEPKTYTVRIPKAGTALPVMVRLNDRIDAPFIIDTGASDVLLPRAFADRLGIVAGPGAVTKQYQTANGLIEAPVVTLDSVSLGGARAENVAASITDTMSHGLLGLSYFNQFRYEIDSARGVVRLTPNGLAQSGALPGGRSERQWRSAFLNLRRRIETIQSELERTPDSRSRKLDRLEEERQGLLEQLARLEADADQARVPFSWRR